MAQYGSEVLAIELADLLESARPATLLRDRVRLDRRDVGRRIDRLTRAVKVELVDHDLDETVASDLVRAAYDLRHAVEGARPVPFTDQVRLPWVRACETATALRAATRI
jgi:hypothetical protein